MKIVHITESFASGTYVYLMNLCNFLVKKEKNLEIAIIYSGNRENFDINRLNKDFDQSISFINVDMSNKINPFMDLVSSYKVSKILKRLNPDIVHLHSSKASVIGRFATFLALTKCIIFYTPHGYSFLRQDISSSKQLIYKNIEKITQKIFGGTTIACGETEYKIASQLGKSYLVNNGIDINYLQKHYQFVENKNLIFGTIGRISPQKNPKLLNDIALRFPDFQFIWIGDGELKNLLTAKNIQITGWITNPDDLYSFINKVDAILQTSLWEGLSLAVLEAMALKKPLISTNTPGNTDLITNNVNGYTFNNINELDLIFKKLKDPVNIKNLGNQSFLICKEKYDSSINFQRLLDYYNFFLNNKHTLD
ncbi:glycosyltransferase [Empedobacter tilapiae]